MFHLKEIESNIFHDKDTDQTYYIPIDSRIIAGNSPLLLQDSKRKITIHTKNYYIDTQHRIHYNPKFVGPIYDTLCSLVPEDLVNMILYYMIYLY